jgi:nitrite reductase/ring-hydroxylating ferredoxin subunit/DMSO/TMAO reductase YedYZ heme-binding membrane subunit
MSHGFKLVQWNRYKIGYDLVLAALAGAYIAGFIQLGPMLWPADRAVDPEIHEMRAFGSCAFLMLTLILCIGPLARLDSRFLPLLYNRRHFGVMTCGVALTHAYFVIDWYHYHGKIGPLLSLLVSNPRYLSFAAFPFEFLGILALLILVVMAATSHDLWLAVLKPPVWKAIHMLVYFAYALLVMHVMLGAAQSEKSPILPALVLVCFVVVASLHLLAGWRERLIDDGERSATDGRDADWLDVGPPESVPDGAAVIVAPRGRERIAIFRNVDRLSALSNVCEHQNGPLGEGRIVDGCITCPWHGFQYRPEDGCSPPPFTEKVSTFRLRLAAGRVQVDPRPLPPGTFVEPLTVGAP